METTRVDIDALATRFLECTPPLDADGKENLHRALPLVGGGRARAYWRARDEGGARRDGRARVAPELIQ